MRRLLKILLKIFAPALVVIAIIVAIFAGTTAFTCISNGVSGIVEKVKNLTGGESEDVVYVDTTMFSGDSYREGLAAQESDIAGWTKLDKYNYGLDPNDGSDTDGDGIPDKDEIEVYGTDPLSVSTAGDLYSDGYKLSNGMDLNTYYDYDGEAEITGNNCSDVVLLTASSAEDLNAVVNTYVLGNIDGYKVYANYNIYNYGGTVAFDVSGIEEKYSVKASALTVLKCDWTGSNMEKMKSSVSGSVITLNESTDYNDDSVYIIAKKNTFSFGSVSDTTIEGATYTADGGVFTLCVVARFFGVKPSIYYVESGCETYDQKNMEILVREANKMIDVMDYETGLLSTIDDVQIVSQARFDFIMKVYAAIPWTKKCVPSDLSGAIGQYLDLEMVTGINELGASETAFTDEDELPFRNFGTYISPGGTCAGIAHLTSLLYNTGVNPSSGSYVSDGNLIEWDLLAGNETDNETLLNSGLHDYKTRAFMEDHTDFDTGIMDVDLTEGETEFTKMISAYWKEANDIINVDDYTRVWGKSDYDWSLIEGMMQFLDRGKILDAAFLIDEDSGHAVNIFRYEISEYDSTLYKFYVYDNNYPGNLWGNIRTDNILYVKKKFCVHSEHNYTTFEYYYKAFDDCDYYFSSTNPETDLYAMIVYDEQWRILNDIYDVPAAERVIDDYEYDE